MSEEASEGPCKSLIKLAKVGKIHHSRRKGAMKSFDLMTITNSVKEKPSIPRNVSPSRTRCEENQQNNWKILRCSPRNTIWLCTAAYIFFFCVCKFLRIKVPEKQYLQSLLIGHLSGQLRGPRNIERSLAAVLPNVCMLELCYFSEDLQAVKIVSGLTLEPGWVSAWMKCSSSSLLITALALHATLQRALGSPHPFRQLCEFVKLTILRWNLFRCCFQSSLAFFHVEKYQLTCWQSGSFFSMAVKPYVMYAVICFLTWVAQFCEFFSSFFFRSRVFHC